MGSTTDFKERRLGLNNGNTLFLFNICSKTGDIVKLPKAENNKYKIIGWVVNWPISMLVSLVRDLIRGIAKRIFNVLLGLYNRITVRVLGSVSLLNSELSEDKQSIRRDRV